METILKRLISLVMIASASVVSLAGPLYPNSVASNDLDFILADDPGACWSIAEKDGGRTEMYDPRRDTLFVEDALRFDITFSDQHIRINVHSRC